MLAAETCDWLTERGNKDSRCGTAPAGYVGDIYYACAEHADDMADWLERDAENAKATA